MEKRGERINESETETKEVLKKFVLSLPLSIFSRNFIRNCAQRSLMLLLLFYVAIIYFFIVKFLPSANYPLLLIKTRVDEVCDSVSLLVLIVINRFLLNNYGQKFKFANANTENLYVNCNISL